MRQENVYVLGHWQVTVTKGNVQALEPMGENQSRLAQRLGVL